MKKLSASLAVSAMFFASCQNLELMDPALGTGNGSIQFGVNTPITRATNLWDNNNFATTAGEFKVFGTFADGTDYLGSVTAPLNIRYEGGEWTYDNKLFWPEQSLDFYSWYTKATGLTLTKGTYPADRNLKIAGYEVKDAVGDQDDFLVGAGVYNKSTISTIYLKHALTKVLFKAEVVSGSKLEVAIESVKIINIKDKGDLTVAPNTDIALAGKPTMNWTTDAAANTKRYDINTQNSNAGVSENLTLTAAAVGTANLSQYLFSAIDGVPEEAKASMLLLPQNFTAWNPATTDIADNAGELLTTDISAAGTFIGVKCTIKSTVGTDVYFHGSNTATRWLYIPVSSEADMYGEWLANRAITYVITFGDAGSGSGGGGWTGEDGEPVLIPINFRVEVSDWDKFDVILQSVNFEKKGLNNTTTPIEMKKITDQLAAEFSYNPQKRYAGNLNFTYQDGIAPNLTLDATVVGLSSFINNEKLLGGSTINISFSANTWTAGESVTFPALEGFTLTGSPLSANGTVVYKKTAIAKIEAARLDKMPAFASMDVIGEATGTATWNYSTFSGLKNDGDWLVLNFVNLTDANTVTIEGPATGFKMAVGADLDAAKVAANSSVATSATTTKDAKFLIIQKVVAP